MRIDLPRKFSQFSLWYRVVHADVTVNRDSTIVMAWKIPLQPIFIWKLWLYIALQLTGVVDHYVENVLF